MSEYNFLTGRKDLFDNAPPEAMVVLETSDGQIYYAVSHNRGAQYWYANGNPGRDIGLIALFEKTRVIASRVRVGGLPPVQPKRDPIPKSRLDRMEKAQKTLRSAVSQPAKVTPKPEPVCSHVLREQGKPYPKTCAVHGLGPCQPKPVMRPAIESAPVITPKVQPETRFVEVAKADGFVSIFELGQRGGSRAAGTFVTVNANGQLSLSAKLPFAAGDAIDIQINQARGLIRLGKVKTGGRPLTKTRMVSCKALTDTFKVPEGEKSIRIHLTETDGWWQGQAEVRK